jgi:hypothetical protein
MMKCWLREVQGKSLEINSKSEASEGGDVYEETHLLVRGHRDRPVDARERPVNIKIYRKELIK